MFSIRKDSSDAVTSASFSQLTVALRFSMAFCYMGLTLSSLLMLLGCTNSKTQSASDPRIWSAQLQRQQEVVRTQGRIGHIGYEGPSPR